MRFRPEATVRRFLIAAHAYEVTAERLPGAAYALIRTESDDLEVRDLRDGTRLGTPERSVSGPVHAFSPTGYEVVTSVRRDARGVVELRDIASGTVERTLEHQLPASTHGFLATGGRLATRTKEGIHVWDVALQRPITSLRRAGDASSPSGFSCSADGSWLVASYEDDALIVWDVDRQREFVQVSFDAGIHINCCAMFPEGERLCAGVAEWRAASLYVIDVRHPEERLALSGHTAPVRSCCVSADGRSIASGAANGEIRVWDARGGEAVLTFHSHASAVNTCAFSPDGRHLVSASEDGTVRVWDIAGRTQRAVFAVADLPSVAAGTFLADNTVLAVTRDGGVYGWDLASRRQVIGWSGQRHVESVVVSPDGKSMAWTGGPRDVLETSIDVVVWNATDGAVRHVLPGHASVVTAAKFSSDGRWLGTLDARPTLRLWDVSSGRQVGALADVSGFVWTPDGRELLTSVMGGHIQIRSAPDWKQTEQIELQEAFGYGVGLIMSPDGTRFVASSGWGPLSLWNLPERQRISNIELGLAHDLQFLDNGRHLVGTYHDEICVWNAETGKRVAAYSFRGGMLFGFKRHPGGRIMAGQDDLGLVHVLQIEGLDLEPPLVTAWTSGPAGPLGWFGRSRRVVAGCPWCRVVLRLGRGALGTQIACAQCGGRLALTTYALSPAHPNPLGRG